MTHPTEQINEIVEVPSVLDPYMPAEMLTQQFCALVIEQAIQFLENLSNLDSSTSLFSTKEVFECKSKIIPNSAVGRHLQYRLVWMLLTLDILRCD